MNAKILLVEDDTSLGFIIADQLKTLGYKVVLCSDGLEGFKKFNEDEYHLCILDVMLPKKDGFELAKSIRKINQNVPILFLSARSMTADKVKGFDAGGDDYLTKPFSSEELGVRVRALLKRVNIIEKTDEENEIKLGKFTFDVSNYLLLFEGKERKLTKKEAQILKLLCKFKNQVLPREIVLNGVWGQDDYFVGRSLDVFVTKLRKYLSMDEAVEIQNVHGIGFKLVVPD